MQIHNGIDINIVYTNVKYWLPLIVGTFAVYRGYLILKKAVTNDLPHIQLGLDSLRESIENGLSNQSSLFVKAMDSNTAEIKELRREFFELALRPRPAKARLKK